MKVIAVEELARGNQYDLFQYGFIILNQTRRERERERKKTVILIDQWLIDVDQSTLNELA